jgi:hypothetical protein
MISGRAGGVNRRLAPDVQDMRMAKKARTKAPRRTRTKRLHMLLSNDEWGMLLELSNEHGLTASDVVRQLVREAVGRWEKEARGGVSMLGRKT